MFEGGHTYMRSAWSRPRSPMKDKPTTRRPPAGPGMDDPDPLGSGAALANPEAHAGPPYARIQCDSVRFTAHGYTRPACTCRSLGQMRRGPDAGLCASLVHDTVTELSLLVAAFRLDENGAV